MLSNTSVIAHIEQLEAERCAALKNKDMATLDRLLHEQLNYVHSSGVVDTKASYLDGVGSGVWDYHDIDLTETRFVVAGDTVLLFCKLSLRMTIRGAFKAFETRALMVWHQDAQGWRQIAVQSSSIPLAA